MLPSGAGTLRDDREGLPEESLDDARTHSRVLCGLQDTGWVGVSQTYQSVFRVTASPRAFTS